MKKANFLRRSSNEGVDGEAPAPRKRRSQTFVGKLSKSGSKLLSSVSIGSRQYNSNESIKIEESYDFDSEGSVVSNSMRSNSDGGVTQEQQRQIQVRFGTRRPSANFTPSLGGAIAEDHDYAGAFPQDVNYNEGGSRRKSIGRRTAVNASDLTMGLSDLSADFLDLMLKSKGIDWLKSLSLRDPRFCIKMFFDDIARDGADGIEDGNGFHPELLSPLLAMFQRSSVFSVWRPTSIDSIEKMMKGHGVGKGLDIKGKSAKKGKLSAYVPFLQIHVDEHKSKIRALPSGGRIRVFYKKEAPRDKAYDFLMDVRDDMVGQVEDARQVVKRAMEDSPDDVVLEFRSKSARSLSPDEEANEAELANDVIMAWQMDDPSIVKIDDYRPQCYGLEMPKRLFWEGYVMRAKNISRPPGSEFDSGRPSQPGFQDMNFASIKDKFDPDSPRAVVWQYTDPYQPRDQPDPDPMLPQTLLVAYEENGRVLPVVSDFDCFLLGTRGIRFKNPLPEEQVSMVLEMIDDTEKILKDCAEGKSKAWTASWFDNMKSKTTHHTMPKYGFGDPKSYAIMGHAVKRLAEFGAVRHGAECFNYYFPQDLDEEYLVIGGNLEGAKYKYMTLGELQSFLSGCIDKGFTFPLNPKWVLCDQGWKAIWDKLLASSHPNVESSINVWCPPNSGIRERIEEVCRKYPQGYKVRGLKKKGTTLWDEAEMALERFQRIQRAKRKLLVVLLWISILQKSQRKVQERNKREGKLEKAKSEDVDRRLSLTKKSTNNVKFKSWTVGNEETDDNSICGSSIASDYTGEDLDTINALLDSNADLMSSVTSFGVTSNGKMARRHTSAGIPRSSIRDFDNMPSFILREFGGADRLFGIPNLPASKAHLSFKSAVQKVIVTNRLMEIAKESSHTNLDYLPVEWTRLSSKSKIRLAKKLSFKSVSSWDFNALEIAEECQGNPLLLTGWAILGSPHAQRSMAADVGIEYDDEDGGYDFVCQYRLKLSVLCAFLRLTESNYYPNPYHNSTHASDVLVTTNSILQLGGNKFAKTPLHVFALLLAAIVHDVQHPGLNNNFQINSHSELAVRYNDVSVLENHSVSWFFSQLMGPAKNRAIDIFSGLTSDEFAVARSVMVKSVLETDMSHHFTMMTKVQSHQEQLEEKEHVAWFEPYNVKGASFNPALDMLCFILHLADISNPAKPHPIFLDWSKLILTECFAQGDKELSMGLPVSPLCERSTTGLRQSQLGFIRFVVQPAFECLAGFLPEVSDTVIPCVMKSLDFWEKFKEDEKANEGNC